MLLLHVGLNSTFGFAILDGQTQVFETESEQKPGICKVFTFRKTPSRGGFACRERSMAFLGLARNRFGLLFHGFFLKLSRPVCNMRLKFVYFLGPACVEIGIFPWGEFFGALLSWNTASSPIRRIFIRDLSLSGEFQLGIYPPGEFK